MKTYRDVLNILQTNPNRLYVPVFFSDHYDWLPVDKQSYIHRLMMIDNLDIPYPCWFQVEPDGEMFIHPNMKNS